MPLARLLALLPGLASLALLATTACAQTAGKAAADTVLTDSVFAPTSFWYTPIPRDAPLHPNSANFVAEILRQKKAFYGTVSVGASSPVYVVGTDVKPVRVFQWMCGRGQKPHAQLVQQWEAVPIPSYAEVPRTPDGEMTVYQPATDTIWEFWQARKVDGKWEACWGGRMQHASKNDGTWTPYDGTTATGLPFLGGQITAEELRRGEIRHVIGIALVELEAANIISWPAKRSDGTNPNREPNRIPEGLRFRLDPAVDVDALRMRPAGKIIARAAQKYGFVVWDKSGSVSLRRQHPYSYTLAGLPDPYPQVMAAADWAVLEGFPWEKLQFLPHDYGKP